MKKVKLLLGTVTILFLSLVSNAKNEVKTDTVIFNVNLHCHSCENLLMKNIPYEKGVKDLKVDLAKDEVTIAFRNDKNSIDGLQKAIEKLGFTASIKVDGIVPETNSSCPINGKKQ